MEIRHGGEAQQHVDIENDLLYNYDYDSTGRFIRETAYEGDERLYTTEYGYDELNNVSRIVNEAYGSSIWQTYLYGKDNLPTQYTASTGINVTYTRDSLNRMWKQTLNTTNPVMTTYARYTSPAPAVMTTIGVSFSGGSLSATSRSGYTRDDNGNITRSKRACATATRPTERITRLLLLVRIRR